MVATDAKRTRHVFGGETGEPTQRQCDLRLTSDGRVATGEDEAQAIVRERGGCSRETGLASTEPSARFSVAQGVVTTVRASSLDARPDWLVAPHRMS